MVAAAMLVEERRQKLADFVAERGYAPLPELARALGVSESTVRRDLGLLHSAGRLRRTHGGAAANPAVADFNPVDAHVLPAFEDRTAQRVLEKRQVGRLAASLVADGETVLLDAGTTTLEVARQLLGRPVTVITNSLPIAQMLGNGRGAEVILIGGYIYPRTQAALGGLAVECLRDLHARKLIMGVAGVTENGVYNGNALLVETERAMMRAASETIVVADHSKFGQPALCFLADWSRVARVVTDAAATPAQRALVGGGAELLIADQAEECA